MEDYDEKEVCCKSDFYKQEIVDLINGIDRLDKLKYLLVLVDDVAKAE